MIYHRWDATERFIIVINFSGKDATVNVPFPTNGIWTDLLNNNAKFSVNNYWLVNQSVGSNWGSVFWQKA